jgi:hypothetical protein
MDDEEQLPDTGGQKVVAYELSEIPDHALNGAGQSHFYSK